MIRPLLRRRTTKGTAEFLLRRPENLLLVKEERNGGLLICATADNLGAEHKEAFVRYLQMEGFVSGVFASSDWFQERVADWRGSAVRWIVDSSWSKADPVYARHVQRLCWCLAGITVAWLALVIALVCC